MRRYKALNWAPLVPEDPLPPRLWAGLPFSVLVACALSLGLIAGVHTLGGGALLVAVDEVWEGHLSSLTVYAPIFLAFYLPPRPMEQRSKQEKQPGPSIAIRLVTFFIWQMAVFATTVFLLRRFSEPLGLDTITLPQDGGYLALALSLFWTVAFFTTVFLLDARSRRVPPA